MTSTASHRFVSERSASRSKHNGIGQQKSRALRLEPLEDRRLLAVGELDPSFGNGGRVPADFSDFTDLIGSDDEANAVVVLSDGKVLVAGRSVLGSTQHGALARYNPNGTLDTTFGIGGKITTPLLTEINDIALLPGVSGAFVVTGPTPGADSNFGVVLYKSDGSVNDDGVFGVDGLAIADFGAGPHVAEGIMVQADGKIVVAGSATLAPGNLAFGVARFTAIGNLDSQFDVDGLRTIDFGAGADVAYDVVRDDFNTPGDPSDDRILLAGSATNTGLGTLDFALARLDSNGTPDMTFNGDGMVTTDFTQNRDDEAFSVVIQPGGQGHIVAAGYAHQLKVVAGNADDDFALARYDNTGSLLPGFGTDGFTMFGPGTGRVTTDFTSDTTSRSNDRIEQIVLQTDGQIVAAGWAEEVPANPLPRRDAAVARYNGLNGKLDASLNPATGGRLLPKFFNFEFERANAVALSGSDLVLAGIVGNSPASFGPNPQSSFGVLRLNSDGTADTAFGNGGRVVSDFTEFVGSIDQANVVIESGGKVLVAGSTQMPAIADRAAIFVASFARYNADGSLDTSFGNGGRITTDLLTAINDLIVLANGKIVATGPTPSGVNGIDFGVLQLNSDGSLDIENFGNRGLAVANFPVNLNDIPHAIVLQNTPLGNRIVVAGQSQTTGTNTVFAVARFTTLGNTDLVFDTDGLQTVDFSPGTDGIDIAYDVAIDNISRIVLAGSATDTVTPPGNTLDFALARLEVNGQTDNTLNTDGRVMTDFGQQRNDEAFSLVIQPPVAGEYQIMVGGYANLFHITTGSEDEDFALARYSQDGDFLVRTTTDFTDDEPSDDRIQEIDRQTDGQIVAAGFAHERFDAVLNPNPRRDVALARYSAAGVIDTTLDPNTGGRLTPDFFNVHIDRANALDIDATGRWLLAGSILNGPSGAEPANFAVLRLTSAGVADGTFGNGGRVVTDFTSFVGSSDIANAVVVQDGKILVAGQAGLGSVLQAAFARYNSDGTLDATFGIGGRLTTSLFTTINDLALLTDGRILATGPFATAPGNIDFGVIQLLSDGSLDEDNFGNRGLAVAGFPTGLNDIPQAIIPQDDGRIVVAGESRTTPTNAVFGVIRFTALGNLDISFDVDGRQTVDFSPGVDGVDIAYDVKIDTLDRLVLAGSATDTVTAPGTLDFALARLDSNGVADATFSSDGRVTTDFFQNRNDEAFSLVLQPNGFIVAGGYALQQKFQGPLPFTPDEDFALARYNNRGDLQGGFGNNGKRVTDFTRDTNFPSNDRIGEIQLDGDDVVAAGFSHENGPANPRRDAAVARYDGVTSTLDTALNPDTGGLIYLPTFGIGDNTANALAVPAAGLWVLAGQGGDFPYNFNVMRLGDAAPTIAGNPDVDYTLRLTDLGGVELPKVAGQYRIGAGVTFVAEVSVTDLRPAGLPGDLRGVFAAFADLVDGLDFVDWIGPLNSPATDSLVVSSSFQVQRGALVSLGGNDVVDEAGGADAAPVGALVPQILFTVRGLIRPTTPLNTPLTLQLNDADDPDNPTRVWGRPGQDVISRYESETVLVVTAASIWQNAINPLDVNNDGQVDVDDLQLVREEFNRFGAGVLPRPTSPNTVPNPTPLIPGTARFFDVNGDGALSSLDAGPLNEFLNAQPLQVDANSPAQQTGQMLSVAAATNVLESAIERFVVAGASADQVDLLQSVQVQVADLPGDHLAIAVGMTVIIDRDAAGRDWFIDATPDDDLEFVFAVDQLMARSGSDAADGVDLLTVLVHELAHVLGADHSESGHDLMAETLAPGVRRLPSTDLLALLFAEDEDKGW